MRKVFSILPYVGRYCKKVRFSGKILNIKLTTVESHAWVENKDLQAIQEMARSDEHAIFFDYSAGFIARRSDPGR